MPCRMLDVFGELVTQRTLSVPKGTPGRRSSASTASPPATRRSIINVKAMRQIPP
jgi:hypothetical protein